MAVPEPSLHVLSVQLAAQLHSNEPTAIDSTSPARPKPSRNLPQPGACATWRSNRQRAHAVRSGMCCANLRVHSDAAGAARCRCGMCMPSRAGEGRRLHVDAGACARMSVRACKCRVRVVMVVLVVMVDSRYGAGWDRDFPESGYPDKDLGSSETESLALP